MDEKDKTIITINKYWLNPCQGYYSVNLPPKDTEFEIKDNKPVLYATFFSRVDLNEWVIHNFQFLDKGSFITSKIEKYIGTISYIEQDYIMILLK